MFYWRHIKSLVDDGAKDYYDELVDFLTIEEKNEKKHENQEARQSTTTEEKTIKREPVIERVVQDPPEYVAKMLKMSNIFA